MRVKFYDCTGNEVADISLQYLVDFDPPPDQIERGEKAYKYVGAADGYYCYAEIKA